MKRLLWLVLLLAACDTSGERFEAVYEVEVGTFDGPERFHLAVATPTQAAIADEALASGRVGVVTGSVVRGDGGFNGGYSWHLDPATVAFPDLATEVCDGRPRSDVEADLDYWVDTVGMYCPWGAEVVRRVE